MLFLQQLVRQHQKLYLAETQPLLTQPRKGQRILAPFRYRQTKAKPKLITATDRCNNAGHCSSNAVSDNETLNNRSTNVLTPLRQC